MDKTSTLSLSAFKNSRVEYRNTLPQYTKEVRAANQALIDLPNRFADRRNATTAQIALAWVLAQKP